MPPVAVPSDNLSSPPPPSSSQGELALPPTSSATPHNSAPPPPSMAPQSSQSSSLRDRILVEEHRFTSLTQNLTHFSPLKAQLDKHNTTIERLEADIAKRNNIIRKCQEKLKTLAKRPSSKQASRISLDATTHASSTEANKTEETMAKHRQAKEELETLNDQLLAAKILHIGLTRQVAQYFESKSELQALLEKIFVGPTPEHPEEDELEREIQQIECDMTTTKNEFEHVRNARKELKEVKRYLDIWNDTMEKQVASQPKDVSKSLKKLVPFFGPKAPSYTKIADQHYKEARTLVPSIQDIGNMSDINMESTALTSSELILYTSKFNQIFSDLSKQLEELHRKHKDLRSRRAQRIEDLFNARCRIFSEELQAYYRSVGASLAAGESVDGPLEGGADAEGLRLTQESRALSGMRRLHVEDETGATPMISGSISYSVEPDSTGAPADDELPSYWQYPQDGGAVQDLHQTLATSSRNSTMSSTTSINTPGGSSSSHSHSTQHHYHHNYSQPFETPNNPPDYVEGGPDAAARAHEDEMFAEYHRRYDTRYAGTLDTPPRYEESTPGRVVDPV